MPQPKRTIEDVRTELADVILAIERSAEKVQHSINQVSIISFNPSLQRAIGIIANEVSSIISRIPAVRQESTELYERAITDGLTKLFNRGFFEDVLKQEMNQSKKAAIIMTDIDHFGKYNNRYGHQQGDVALRTVAESIKRATPVKTIARYGGEEFSIILAHYSGTPAEISNIAEKIRFSVEQTILPVFSKDVFVDEIAKKWHTPEKHVREYLSNELTSANHEKILRTTFPHERTLQNYLQKLQRVTVSVGAAVKQKKEDVEKLIYRADEALYQAKKSGRNRVILA